MKNRRPAIRFAICLAVWGICGLLSVRLLPTRFFGGLSAFLLALAGAFPLAKWTEHRVKERRAIRLVRPGLVAAVVLAIMWFAGFGSAASICKARADRARPLAETIVAALSAYRAERGAFPESLDRLDDAVLAPTRSRSVFGRIPIRYVRPVPGDFRLDIDAFGGAGWRYTPVEPEGSWTVAN